jgi:hypothetical protein
MVLLEMNGILSFIIIVYLICHSPAIILLIVGLNRLKTKPENAKKLLIIAGIYFLIGAGICGALLT